MQRIEWGWRYCLQLQLYIATVRKVGSIADLERVLAFLVLKLPVPAACILLCRITSSIEQGGSGSGANISSWCLSMEIANVSGDKRREYKDTNPCCLITSTSSWLRTDPSQPGTVYCSKSTPAWKLEPQKIPDSVLLREVNMRRAAGCKCTVLSRRWNDPTQDLIVHTR